MAGASANDRSAPNSTNSRPYLKTVEIAARHEIEPFRQGNLDGLCGLYSAINGLRLALHPHRPLNRTGAKRLFRSGVEYLDRKQWLGDAIQNGMSKGRWHRLIRHLIKQISKNDLVAQAEMPSFAKRPSIDDVFSWIADSLAIGAPVLACFADYLDHYSVVVAIDDRKLRLFDSSGFKHVLRASCGIGTGRHQITPGALIRIAVRQAG